MYACSSGVLCCCWIFFFFYFCYYLRVTTHNFYFFQKITWTILLIHSCWFSSCFTFYKNIREVPWRLFIVHQHPAQIFVSASDYTEPRYRYTENCKTFNRNSMSVCPFFSLKRIFHLLEIYSIVKQLKSKFAFTVTCKAVNIKWSKKILIFFYRKWFCLKDFKGIVK